MLKKFEMNRGKLEKCSLKILLMEAMIISGIKVSRMDKININYSIFKIRKIESLVYALLSWAGLLNLIIRIANWLVGLLE